MIIIMPAYCLWVPRLLFLSSPAGLARAHVCVLLCALLCLSPSLRLRACADGFRGEHAVCCAEAANSARAAGPGLRRTDPRASSTSTCCQPPLPHAEGSHARPHATHCEMARRTARTTHPRACNVHAKSDADYNARACVRVCNCLCRAPRGSCTPRARVIRLLPCPRPPLPSQGKCKGSLHNHVISMHTRDCAFCVFCCHTAECVRRLPRSTAPLHFEVSAHLRVSMQ